MTIQFLHRILDSISDFIPVSGVPCTYIQDTLKSRGMLHLFVLRSQLVDPLMIVDIHVGIVAKDTFFCQVPPPIQFQESILLLAM